MGELKENLEDGDLIYELANDQLLLVVKSSNPSEEELKILRLNDESSALILSNIKAKFFNDNDIDNIYVGNIKQALLNLNSIFRRIHCR